MTDAPTSSAARQALLPPAGVRLGLASTDRGDAIRQAGKLLVDLDAVEPGYADAMPVREEMMSSYVGEGFAIPHGTDDARALVKRAALVFLQFPDGIDWDGQTAHVVIGIAAAADEHMAVMQNLAMILLDPEQAGLLRTTSDVADVIALLDPEPTSDTTTESTP